MKSILPVFISLCLFVGACAWGAFMRAVWKAEETDRFRWPEVFFSELYRGFVGIALLVVLIVCFVSAL